MSCQRSVRCKSREHFEFWSASDPQAAQTGNIVLMVKLASIISTRKAAAAESTGEGNLNSRISLEIHISRNFTEEELEMQEG